MFKSTAVLYSALSKRTKRVQVQILKDFPRFHLYKGEVAKVKPSLMLNYLHYGNGARYILEESQVDQALLEYSKQQAEIRKAALAQEKKLQAEQAMVIEEETFELQKDIPKEDIEQKKGFLDSEITIKDVNIPGLRL
ncbi:mitochondrial 54S ribosomal protein bL9m MRPL50 [Nakaseomyces bracarensis]|uniref:mitochondrial 54S ribosomal protein bL9m MRPL50 n=1 Tax=Nakaseomyces bracarensis TaxID=273131 RepID=UPI0038724ED3